MNRNMFGSTRRRTRHWVIGSLFGTLLLYIGATAIGEVSEEAKRRGTRADFGLFAEAFTILVGNQVSCGLISDGTVVCGDESGSGTVPGGFWPKNSPNSYIFNTGLQMGAIIGADGGPWASDTAASFFFDSKGLTEHGDPLSSIYRSLEPGDLDIWGQDAEAPADPARAFIDDPDLFFDALIGKPAASQEDSWVAYWDGNPVKISGRGHPLGVMVYQRSMAWNFPSGNESVIYFLYTFKNVTNTPEFQIPNEAAFFGGDNALPDGGYTFTDAYASFGTDMDVGASSALIGTNYSTVVLPFDLGLSYMDGFQEPNFNYPPELFFPPFFTNAPGLVGIKYLKSPLDPLTGEEVGLTLFGITDNQGNFFGDANDDKQLYRYMTGRLDPAQGDQSCNVLAEVISANPQLVERSVCFVAQSSADTRFFQASGPFELAPDEEGTIVVAYVLSPTVQTMPNGDPSGIVQGSGNPPGFPSFHPGFAGSRGCDSNGENCAEELTAAQNDVKNIERAAGWVEYTGSAPTGRGNGALESPENKIDQDFVETVPGSLLDRALVAQTVFNNKFLLGFAPVAPTFALVPGDGQVTIIWEPSLTETEGDAFADIAADPESPLFNPNYRKFDVEGYRIYRQSLEGQAPELLAQFDYANTVFTDATCETVQPDEDIGNPNGIGYVVNDPCSLAADPQDRSINANLIFNNGGAGFVPGAGVVRLADGTALGTTLLSPLDDGLPTTALVDEGVPFAFVDANPVNNFTYIYSVEAFDVNSMASGPGSLRSARNEEVATPRVFASNVELPFAFTVSVTGDDGEPLDTEATQPQPDPDTGIFPGPAPPTNAASVATIPAPAAAAPLLAPGTVTVTIDSVVPHASIAASASGSDCLAGQDARNMCWRLYTTSSNGIDEPVSAAIWGWTPFDAPVWGDPSERDGPVGSATLPFSDTELEKYDIDPGFGQGVQVGVGATYATTITNSATEALQVRANITGGQEFGPVFEDLDNDPTGSRWFDGDTETLADPTAFTWAGAVAAADTIFHPVSHTRYLPDTIYPASSQMVCWPYMMAILTRAADVRFTWGGGTFSEVRDVTHHLEVPFQPNPRGSWGFMNEDANGNGMIDWQDFDYLDGISQNSDADGWGGGFCYLGAVAGINNPPLAQLSQTPQLQATNSMGIDPATMTAATGQGFGLYVNGEHYIFEMSSLPADETVWTLRTFQGFLQADGSNTADPFDYELLPASTALTIYARPPNVTGLQFVVDITEAGSVVEGKPDLTNVHTVPDPYLASSQFDIGTTEHRITFVNLPVEATIRIYTLTGILVDVVEHQDSSGGGREQWDLRNRNNNFVASGVYFFHVVTPEADEYVGKFTVVNFGAQN